MNLEGSAAADDLCIGEDASFKELQVTGASVGVFEGGICHDLKSRTISSDGIGSGVLAGNLSC